MTEQNSKSENGQRRFSQQQYDMLKRCSDKKDMTEWNQWREKHPDEVIWLQGRNFNQWWLQKVNFMHGSTFKNNTYTNFGEVHLEGTHFEWANLQKTIFAGARMNSTRFWSAHAEDADFHGTWLIDAELGVAHFEGCDFSDSVLYNASFTPSWLNGTKFTNSDMRGCHGRSSVVDGSTRFWECIINRYSKDQRFTDFTGVPLGNVIIDPATKQLLEYNIRRMNWEDWYKKHWFLRWPVRLFWCFSDYGINTGRIIGWFFGLALFFATIYANLAYYCPLGIVSNLNVEPHLPIWHYFLLLLLRPIYFSIITMTLGFSDMYANAQSIWGHILITV
jgi:uncharacterized protein YjbI with pentapeptide repeats